MRILFLDVDGVLNGHERHKNGYCGIKPENVAVLNKLLDQLPDLKLVISSSWRYMMPKAMNILGFEYVLLIAGVNCKGRVHGHTPFDEEVGGRSGRGQQIRHYLEHKLPRHVKYVVLDDLLFDFQKCGLNFVLTDPAKGLQPEQVPVIIDKLK
jgi:hypothetical protein